MVKIYFMVFWVVVPYSKDGGSMVLWNTGIQLQHHMLQQPRKQFWKGGRFVLTCQNTFSQNITIYWTKSSQEISKLGLPVWHRIPKTKENPYVQVWSQNDADLFFGHKRGCPQGVCPSRTTTYQAFY
jgi:hypothetical protein